MKEVGLFFSSCVCTDLCVLHGHNPSPSNLNLWAPGLRAPMYVTASVDEHGAAWVGADPCGLSAHTTQAAPGKIHVCAGMEEQQAGGGHPTPVGTMNCLRIPQAPPAHLTHCSGKRSAPPLSAVSLFLCVPLPSPLSLPLQFLLPC